MLGLVGFLALEEKIPQKKNSQENKRVLVAEAAQPVIITIIIYSDGWNFCKFLKFIFLKFLLFLHPLVLKELFLYRLCLLTKHL